MLGNIDAELKLVIAGNHDKDLDSHYWKTHPMLSKDHPNQDKEAKRIMTGPLATAAGVTYLEEGLFNFTLKSGATFTIYTSPYQPEFYDFAFPYYRNQDRFNPESHVADFVTPIAKNLIPDFGNVDIIMTHGPPEGILDETKHGIKAGCEALLRAASRAKPRLYCFGHIHEGYGAKVISWKDNPSLIGAEAIENEDPKTNAYPESCSWPIEFGKETVMINAAIRDIRSKPTNAPWIVELDLSLAGA